MLQMVIARKVKAFYLEESFTARTLKNGGLCATHTDDFLNDFLLISRLSITNTLRKVGYCRSKSRIHRKVAEKSPV